MQTQLEYSQNHYKKREISKVVNLPRLNVNVLDFLLRSSEYNIFSLNIAIRLCLNPSLNLENPNSSYDYEIGDQKIQIQTSKRKRVLDVLSSKGKQPMSKLQLRTKAQVSETVLRNLEEKGVIKKKVFKKGDIIFWKGHVAICLNSNNLIHAYGPRKKVLIMPINKTIKLIEKTAHLKISKVISI